MDEVLWPYFPLPEIRETLSWRTNVLSTRSLEDRFSLRPARRSYTYEYRLDDKSSGAQNAVYKANAFGDWLVPLWTEASLITIAAADTQAFCETDASYTDMGLIYTGCNKYSLVTIIEVGAGVLTLDAPTSVDYNGALICPVVRAYATNGLAALRTVGGAISRKAITFSERVNAAVEATSYPQHLGLDVVNQCAAGEQLDAVVSPVVVFVDNGAGPIVLEPSRESVIENFTMSVMLETSQKRRAFQKWLNYVRGMDREFWLAGWADDLPMMQTILAADAFVDVAPVFADLSQYAGLHIQIDGGGRDLRTVSHAASSGPNHRLYIASLGRDVVKSRISILRRVRLAVDELELTHHRGVFAKCRFPVVGVDA